LFANVCLTAQYPLIITFLDVENKTSGINLRLVDNGQKSNEENLNEKGNSKYLKDNNKKIKLQKPAFYYHPNSLHQVDLIFQNV
jgi:hypothetical protein